MPRKKKPPLDFREQMKRVGSSMLERPPGHIASGSEADDARNVPLERRVKEILRITDRINKNKNRMLFFVMYDIGSNKVRTLVHKYLKRKGCTPIQESIFLADLAVDVYNEIKDDLAAVQSSYDNDDSIIILPVSTDYLRMMKVIGKNLDVDVITHSRSTLFF